MENFEELGTDSLGATKADTVLRSGIAIVDQGVVSAVTFLVGIFLARSISQAEYGVFVLAYAVLLFTSTVQISLVINPMMILQPAREGAGLRRYMAATALLQLALNVVIAALIMAPCLFRRLPFPNADFFLICPALAFAIFAFQSQEFFRRALFARMDFSGALMNDMAGYGLQVAGLILLACTRSLSAVGVFRVMGVSFAIAALLGYFQCRPFLGADLSGVKTAMRENWGHGKWLLGSNLTLWLSGQSYFFITAFFLGPAGPAILKACQNIVAPTHVVLYSLENIIPATASRRLAEKGLSAFEGFLKMTARVIAGTVIPYCVAVSFSAEWFLNLLYAGQYRGYGAIVIIVVCQYLINSMNVVDMIGLRALNRPRSIFFAYAAASALTLVISVPLVRYWGVAGGAAGALVSSAAGYALNRRAFRRCASEIRSSVRQP